jgi:tRNA (guanine37-N1)-methyltransferase
MIADILTLFPEMTDGFLHNSIMRRARELGLLNARVHNLRDYAHDAHRIVDDRPFGGGPGMILKCEPLVEAIEAIAADGGPRPLVIYMTPEGEPFDQKQAFALSREKRLLLVSGHYEGIDERVREGWIDRELSIGDYVLTNGTLPALVVVDAVTRLLPGVLGNEDSQRHDSFCADGLLEGPQYTRPEVFRDMPTPKILLSGHHGEIAAWRREQALARTRGRRTDLFPKELDETQAPGITKSKE